MAPKKGRKSAAAEAGAALGTGEHSRALAQIPLQAMIEGWRTNPQGDPEFLKLAEGALETAKQSYGYDSAAPTTRNGLALHLREYEHIMEGFAKLKNVEFNDQYLWGNVNLEDNLRVYLALATRAVKPRKYTSGAFRFNTMIQRRQSMLYWFHRKAKEEIHHGRLFNASQEALTYAYRQLETKAPAATKHYLNRLDILKLMEHDMWRTANPELAQQMHLAWLLGFVCGVRPGSIGLARGRPGEFLSWKDVEITRFGGVGSNNFQVVITFRFLKGYREENMKSIKFTCSAPRFAEDVMYSIAHRILAIALRRGVLAKYTTAAELLVGQEVNIAFRPAALDMPIICVSSPRGVTLDYQKAARSESLSEYIQRRALEFGLPSGVTHYAWRRSAATRVAHAMGAETARQFLAHDAKSRTFETSYNMGNIAIDVVGIAQGREPLSPDELLEDSGLVVNRIKMATQDKQKFIDEFVTSNEAFRQQEQLVQQARLELDVDVDNLSKLLSMEEAEKKLRNMFRALRTQAKLAFQRIELDMLKENLTIDDLEKRKAELQKPGQLQQMIMDAAKGIDLDEAIDPANDDEERPEAYETDDLQDVRDRDADETEVTIPNLSLHGTTDEMRNELGDNEAPATGAQPLDATGLAAGCRVFMDVLTGQKHLHQAGEHCRLCLDDPTIPQKSKDVLYKPAKLAAHLASNRHTPKEQFLRKHKGGGKCPYDCGLKFKTGSELLTHIHGSRDQSDEHLLAAAKDGLFSRDFDPIEKNISSTTIKTVGGVAQRVQVADADEVPWSAVIPSSNVTADGVEPRSSLLGLATSNATNPVLRLPTLKPATESQWWKEHESGVYGDVPNVLQAQRRLIMDRIDKSFREYGHGQADVSGSTRKKSMSGGGSRRKTGLAALRRRLQDLDWSWADAPDSTQQPDDPDEYGDEEPWEGFGDDDDAAAGPGDEDEPMEG